MEDETRWTYCIRRRWEWGFDCGLVVGVKHQKLAYRKELEVGLVGYEGIYEE